MVHYLSETGKGIARYAEMDSGIMGVPLETYQRQMEYAEPDKVDPNALKENVSVRQQGYWVKPEAMPKQYLWANGDHPLPDVLPGFVVSPRFKELVEEFEARVHQFVPIEIYRQRDGVTEVTYYWFIVGQRLDSVDREHTTFFLENGKWVDSIMDTETWNFTKIPDAKLVFSNRKSSGHHIWHDPYLLTFGNGLCSDAFAKAAVKAAFTGLAITPRESA